MLLGKRGFRCQCRGLQHHHPRQAPRDCHDRDGLQHSIPIGAITGTGPDGAVSNTNSGAVNVTTIASGNVTKAFGTSPIAQGGQSTLTITLYNRTVTALTGVNLTDNLPAGLTLYSNPAAPTAAAARCRPFPNGSQIVLTGGTVPARPAGSQGANCVITAKVTGMALGSKTNTINASDSAASASISITTGLAGAKSFTPASPCFPASSAFSFKLRTSC